MALGTVSGLRAYADARGFTAPGLGIEALASQALVRANDYIEANYTNRFYEGVSREGPLVEAAVYEAACLEVETPGFFTKVYTPGERKVLTEVKGIKWTVLPDAGQNGASPISSRIDALLGPLKGGGFFVGVI